MRWQLFNTNHSTSYQRKKRDAINAGCIFKTYDINGLSCDNMYVPITAPSLNLGIYNGSIIHYSIPKPNGYNVFSYSSYARLYSGLSNSSLPFTFKTKSMEEEIWCMKGLMFKRPIDSKVNILFLLAVQTQYVKRMNAEASTTGVYSNMSKFAIFISTEFFTSAKYKSLYNKLYREVLKEMIEAGVELIITNNIEEKCFKNNLEKPKFRAITEMQEYLSSFNQAI